MPGASCTGLPESSPATQTSLGAYARAWRALMRAFSSKVSPSSTGGSGACQASICQPGSVWRSSVTLCGLAVATRSFTASGLPGDRLVLGSAKLGDARRREVEQLAEQLT